MLHRDIKPGNVIVGKHGETLVVDWGLAKPLGRVEPGSGSGERTLMPSSASGSAETLPGCALGTPAYMSPEQAAGDLDRLGPRSDVYSLGATLYCLLTGKPPFEGEDVGEVLRKVQQGEFPPPRQLDPSIDPALEAVCLKAMATKPEDRYASLPGPGRGRRAVDGRRAGLGLARAARRGGRGGGRSGNRTAVTAAAVALVAGVVGLSAVLAVQTKAKADIARSLASETRANAAPGRGQRRAEPLEGRRAGPVRPGRRRDQDVPHRRQRGLPAQAGPVQGAARPAAEVGVGLLRQARRRCSARRPTWRRGGRWRRRTSSWPT